MSVMRRYTGPDGLPWIMTTDATGAVTANVPEALWLAFEPERRAANTERRAALLAELDATYPDDDGDV